MKLKASVTQKSDDVYPIEFTFRVAKSFRWEITDAYKYTVRVWEPLEPVVILSLCEDSVEMDWLKILG